MGKARNLQYASLAFRRLVGEVRIKFTIKTRTDASSVSTKSMRGALGVCFVVVVDATSKKCITPDFTT